MFYSSHTSKSATKQACTRYVKATAFNFCYNGSKLRGLMEEAMKMRERAYCPYSKFRVGASVLTADNLIFSGCNVENASYGLTICAERVAVCNAISQGADKFVAMAVCCDIKNSFKGPCGACRQTLVEFGTNWSLYCVKPDGSYAEVNVGKLLPMGFHPTALEEEKVVTQ